MGNRERTHGINIRVTEEEKQQIERCAALCRLSVSEYLRRLACGQTAAANKSGSVNDERTQHD